MENSEIEVQTTTTEKRIAFSEKRDILLGVQRRIDEYISATNTKTSQIFTLNALVFAGLGIITSVSDRNAGFWVGIALVIAILATLTSMLISVYVLFPNLDSNRQSLLFFQEIQSLSDTHYEDSIAQMTEASYLEDLTHQVHSLSGVAAIKYSWLTRSYYALGGSLICYGTALLITIFQTISK